MLNPTDPIYHGAADMLDDDHPLVWESVQCIICRQIVHIGNEFMDEWFETFIGPMCFDCFAAHPYRSNMPGPGSVVGDDSVVHHWGDMEWVAADIKQRNANIAAFAARYGH
jgi:hypothetical protein